MSPPRKYSASSRPRCEVGVGDGGPVAAAAVARRAGIGARRLGADLEQAQLVETGEAATTGADLDEVDRRHGHREPGALLEAVDAGDLERVGQLRLAAGDEAGLGGRAAHVEAEQSIDAEALGEPAARRGRRRPGPTRPGGSATRAASSAATTPPLDSIISTEPPKPSAASHFCSSSRYGPMTGIVAALHAVVIMRGYSRICGEMSLGDAHRHTERLAQVIGDRALVGRVGVRVDAGRSPTASTSLSASSRRSRRAPLGMGVGDDDALALVRSATSKTSERGTGGAGNSIWRSYMS